MALRSFIAATALCLVGGAAGLAGGAAAQTDAVGQLLGDAQVDEAAIERDRHERMTVPVTIAGEGPYRFLIDTGAQATVVTHELVDNLSLRRSGTATLVAMASSQQVETIELDDLEFANRSVSGLISPLLHAENIGADGILGLDSLQDTRVLIDFRERRIQVADSEDETSNSGYEIVVRARRKLGQMIITDAKLNGVKTAVIIDTGAQNSIANSKLLAKLRSRNRSEMTSIDVHGMELVSNSTLVRSLQIGGVEISNAPIGFADSPIFAALGLDNRPALVLGIGNLRAFDRVAIDFSTQKILFDLPRNARLSSQDSFSRSRKTL
ncbi:retroviral-like aspartic protease family protein [Qipengyuania zhejiangensis]|uniref:retroviral-like aspartic protease family protein n=1 Tax=Qipengyuania zhejiangensis TaxID=3077782 RepID=UPI002D79F947|nr:retroviral-like aspartic protease family protein [Qipengyuania sp. Z2]